MREFPGFSLHVLARWSGDCGIVPPFWGARAFPEDLPFAAGCAHTAPGERETPAAQTGP